MPVCFCFTLYMLNVNIYIIVHKITLLSLRFVNKNNY